MENNILMIRTLAERFFDGATTLDEEQRLYAFFRQAERLPEDLERLRPMFAGFDALANDVATVPEAPASTSHRWRRWAVAAVAAVVVVGGAMLLFRRQAPVTPETEEELVAYVYGRCVTDRDIVLGEMQRTMTAMATTDGCDVVEEQLRLMFQQ